MNVQEEPPDEQMQKRRHARFGQRWVLAWTGLFVALTGLVAAVTGLIDKIATLIASR